ncbi:MAG TPA: immunoglobulin domain-containing protein [Opitutaceae bacterium]|nr:immunoglobulin domain-containing protein [Opitutaceae bacterium]
MEARVSLLDFADFLKSALQPLRSQVFFAGLLAFGLVRPACGSVPLVQLSPSLYQTEHCLFIIDTGGQFGFPAYNSVYSQANIATYINTLTTQFPGNYFSVCLMANNLTPNMVPNYVDRIFKATGINEPGTPGVQTPDYCRYALGGGTVITGALGVYDHELGHAWGAQLLNQGGHWLSNSTVYCQLSSTYSDDGYATIKIISGDPAGGFVWTAMDNLTSNETQIFSDQLLYLMGVNPTFPTFYVLNNPVYNADHTMSYSSITTYDHQTVVNTYGPRSPDFRQSSKHFKLGFVYVAKDLAEVLAAYDPMEKSIRHFCTAEAIDTVNYRFQVPFLVETKFRASVDSLLSDLDGNASPTLAVSTPYVLSTDGAATISFQAADPDGPAPQVSVIPASGNCVVQGNTVAVSGLSNGVYFYTLKAADAGNKTAFDHFVVEVQLAPPVAPTITTQPLPAAGIAGQGVAFTVVASGTSPTYQWRKNGAAISGATSPTLTLIGLQGSDAGSYDVVITNAAGSVTSNPVALTINFAPSVTASPQAAAVIAGQNASFSVTAAGDPTLTYQWRKNGSVIGGATTATLALSNVQASDAGSYDVVVTNAYGSATSAAAILTVYLAPAIVTPPQSAVLTVGQNVSLTVTATGTPAPAYQWRKNGAILAGETFATLALVGVQLGDAGSYTVDVTNLAGSVTSGAATLVVNPLAVAPVITTQPASQTATFGSAVSFTVAASGTPAPSFQWYRNNSPIGGATGATLSLSNVQAPDAGSYTVTATNSAGSATSSAAVLAVIAPTTALTITTQPASQTVTAGGNVNFVVAATGSPAPTFQWLFNGAPIGGATGSTLTLSNVQASAAGSYSVILTNSVGSVTSSAATLTVNPLAIPPTITTQPVGQTVVASANVTFTVTATGTPAPSYQWRFNQAPISGATGATLTLLNVQASAAGSYSVVVTNSAGSVASSAAVLVVTQALVAPTITTQPASQSVLAERGVTFSAAASGSPVPAYQWYFNGQPIAGATSASYSIARVQPGNAGSYWVVATNSAGSATSASATLTVAASPFAGVYAGQLGAGGSAGDFFIYLRADGTGAMLLLLPGSGVAILVTSLTLDADGTFSADGSEFPLQSSPADAVPGRDPSSAVHRTITGSIAGGTVSGTVGGRNVVFSGTQPGGNAGGAGFYQAPAINGGSGGIYAIVAPNGRALVVGQNGAAADGGLGTVGPDGSLTIATAGGATFNATLNPGSGAFSGTSDRGSLAGQVFSGLRDNVLHTDRLANISTRGRSGPGDDVMIAGFIISGDVPRQVLVRAVGPALSGLGVAGAMSDTRLELYQGPTKIAESDNWGTEVGAGNLMAAASRVGAFELPATGKDAALLVTLDPGLYTAQVRGPGTATGVVLVEVYDAGDPPSASLGPKLVNISSRGRVGTDDEILIAGIIVGGNAPKKVLVRAVGPGLAQLGVSGTLADPVLTIFSGSTPISQNDDWGGEAAVTAVANAVGAFPIAADSRDACLLITLAPGTYTAQVRGKSGTTGIVLVEVYDVPD